ncbi:unnamed protein product [Candida verbasci]|uniref:Pre-mRNA splicing factor ini1 n=1 Tax=Candida verbasci TaxID=1227364 RepID=A0A9W4TWM1_9ASCO|nr:unnamed protein product [Candida verbasci]
MSKHQYDLIQCMKQPGRTNGLVCLNCDGRCPICDSMVKPTEEAKICHSCSQGSLFNKCILCGNYLGANNENSIPANYCFECVLFEKHREGCPRVINVGSNKADLIFKNKK